MSPTVLEVFLDQAPWIQLQTLLDDSFPRPPKNVYELVIAASHSKQRLWLAYQNETVVGMVILSPHSKGGHLDTLAVSPFHRGKGIARKLVNQLLSSVSLGKPSIVTLTTRIPDFFSSFGFQSTGALDDGSIAMILFL